MVRIYSAKSGKTLDELVLLLENETWLTANEAKELNLADEVLPEQAVAARANWAGECMRRYGEKMPEGFKRSIQPIDDVLSVELDPVIEVALPAELDPVIEDAQLTEIDMVRAAEINGLCVLAGCPDKGLEFIVSGKEISVIREELLATNSEIVHTRRDDENLVNSGECHLITIYDNWNKRK
jgi:hypothetical protein